MRPREGTANGVWGLFVRHQQKQALTATTERDPCPALPSHLRLELVEPRAIQQARQHRPHVKGLLGVGRDDAWRHRRGGRG